ncbi:uncharacterized protein LOC115406995 [Salarias fasciatus]|uniref:uncharacterized protein LOC115406995 n=1 Tax=Salarias fasciatus TaxID=181472 RepID=UPI0011768BA0|nr:uncharacterized protein LOC115406995 [Salarias fasciatus]
MTFIDGRKCRDSEVYRKVSKKLREAGFIRTPDQIRHRWKTLKAMYCKAKKDNGTSGSDPSTFPQFDLMEEILCQRPTTTAPSSRVDVERHEEEPATPVSSTSNISGSGSVKLEDDDYDDVDDKEDNEAKVPSMEPSNATSPPQSTQHSNATPATECGSSRRPRPRGTVSHHLQFLERMQTRQNQWMERQRQLSHARDEALLTRLIAETNRSTEMLVNQLLTGLGTLLQQPSQPQPARGGHYIETIDRETLAVPGAGLKEESDD